MDGQLAEIAPGKSDQEQTGRENLTAENTTAENKTGENSERESATREKSQQQDSQQQGAQQQDAQQGKSEPASDVLTDLGTEDPATKLGWEEAASDNQGRQEVLARHEPWSQESMANYYDQLQPEAAQKVEVAVLWLTDEERSQLLAELRQALPNLTMREVAAPMPVVAQQRAASEAATEAAEESRQRLRNLDPKTFNLPREAGAAGESQTDVDAGKSLELKFEPFAVDAAAASAAAQPAELPAGTAPFQAGQSPISRSDAAAAGSELTGPLPAEPDQGGKIVSEGAERVKQSLGRDVARAAEVELRQQEATAQQLDDRPASQPTAAPKRRPTLLFIVPPR